MNQLKHLALVMDGNGRWAQQRNKSRTVGHIAGARRAFEIIENLALQQKSSGLETVTVFAFSKENRNRPPKEVLALMNLLAQSIQSRMSYFILNRIRLYVIGDRTQLGAELVKVIEAAEQATADGNGLNLVISINYSGQWDILQAAHKTAIDSAGKKSSCAFVPREFEARLSTAPFGPVDLLIRTGGERRISNFLLWQIAYAEIYFEQKLWPDYTFADLHQVIEEFQSTERRFGNLKTR